MRLKTRVEELEATVEMLATLCHKQTEIIEKSGKDFDEVVELCSKMDKRIDKQEETIKDLMELCEPLLEERLAKSLGKVNDILESALKDLFSSEPAPKCKKGAKSSAEKCKKCGETKKGEEKCSVAKKKSKKS